MFERISKTISTSISVQQGSSDLSIGTDLNRDPVYLSGKVTNSTSFAQAMLVLGGIARTAKPEPTDHSAYQTWVQHEYLKVVQQKLKATTPEQQDLSSELDKLRSKRESLSAQLKASTTQIAFSSLFRERRQSYQRWVRYNDKEAWLRTYDPIVSVQKDGTFFEAFSGDETIYARVFLPHEGLETTEQLAMGTTNIDFSLLMEREFERVRSYRPMNLTVGLKSVDFQTQAAVVQEEKIALPETWVRGLAEVQSVLSLASTDFNVSAEFMAEIVTRLKSERERSGPRSLKFRLVPGEQISVEIEPWGEVIVDNFEKYEGSEPTEVRIWGRRRLFALEEILIDAQKVKVRLLGSGMPSFWTIVIDKIELTVGLSGWSTNDWASKARFSNFVSSADIQPEELEHGLKLIEEEGSIQTGDFADLLGVTAGKAATILQKLSLHGKAMFDPERSIYRWRDLFPTLDIYEERDSSREEIAAIEIVKAQTISVTKDEMVKSIRNLEASVDENSKSYSPSIQLDLDFRPKTAVCNCPFYKYNKLKQGPCRHMIALSIQGASN